MGATRNEQAREKYHIRFKNRRNLLLVSPGLNWIEWEGIWFPLAVPIFLRKFHPNADKLLLDAAANEALRVRRNHMSEKAPVSIFFFFAN